MRNLFGGLVLAVFAGTAYAADYATDQELATTLPKFCYVKHKQAGTPQEAAEKARFGHENWGHMHHYCAALAHADRARRAKSQAQAMGELRVATEQYEYVNRGFSPTFWMRPQMYVEWGNALVKLKRQAEAVKLFDQAIRLNPTYLAAYLQLADTFRELGMKAEALDVATRGLRQIPNAPALQKAYLDAGGAKPFPEPEKKAVAEEVSNDKPAASAASGTAEGKGALEEQSSSGQSAKTNEGGEGPVLERGCRFCPPEEIQKKWRESFGEQPKQ